MNNAVEAIGLTKRFGEVTALDALDLAIPTGAIFGVIGPNGAGKTTLMRLLLDILRPTAGSVRVLGEDPQVGGELRARIGYLPGELRLDPNSTGRGLVRFWASLGTDRGAATRGEEIAERLGVDLGRRAGHLSKGNKQKLGVVQAFMHRPELLILDEPTSGLDPLVQQTFLELVREAHADGATVFLSSHILSEVERVADSAAILRSGRVVREASMSELRATAVRHLRAVVQGSTEDVAARFAAAGIDILTEDAGAGEVRVSGIVEGKANDVVGILGAFRVLDLVFSEPDLEETVLGIYSEEDK